MERPLAALMLLATLFCLGVDDSGSRPPTAAECTEAKTYHHDCIVRSVDLANCDHYRQTADSPVCSEACGTGCERGTIWTDCQYARAQLASPRCTNPPPNWHKCALAFRVVERCPANSSH